MAVPGNELHDIADPRDLLPGIEVPLWFWIVLGTLLLAAATTLWILLAHRKAASPPPEVSYYRESRRALEQLRESLSDRTLSEVATAASLVMRHYLEETLEEPALFETHEEFLLRSDALAKLPAGARERLAPLLDQLAHAKYEPSAFQNERAVQLVERCLEVLQGVESTRLREVA